MSISDPPHMVKFSSPGSKAGNKTVSVCFYTIFKGTSFLFCYFNSFIPAPECFLQNSEIIFILTLGCYSKSDKYFPDFRFLCIKILLIVLKKIYICNVF